MLEKYHQILGIADNATLADIKKAFRLRAKELHPDVNKSPDAHAEFILLVEAYEHFVNRKTGKVYDEDNTITRRYQTYERWQDNEAARAQHRAEYYSNLNYTQFTGSDYYKKMTSVDIVIGHLSLFFSLGVFTLLPVYLYLAHGFSGLAMGILGIFITLPVTVDSIKTAPPLNLKEFFGALLLIAKTKIAIVSIITLFNFFTILKVGFQTLIPFYSMILIFALTIAVAYAFATSILKIKTKSSSIIAFCYAPFVLNTLLMVNYLFSRNPVYETYSFVHEKSQYDERLDKDAYINIENDKYASYQGLRMFADFDAMKNARQITYKFEDGLLGIRVMKDFHFE